MSVSSVGSISDPYQTASAQKGKYSTVSSDFRQLGDALSSGDLAQAQQAFSTLQSALPSGASNTPLGKALGSIGQALQSGNVEDAQQAFTALQQQMQSHRGHHHHHKGGAATQAAGSPTPNADASSSTIGTIVKTSA